MGDGHVGSVTGSQQLSRRRSEATGAYCGKGDPVREMTAEEGEPLVSVNILQAHPKRIDAILFGIEGGAYPYDRAATNLGIRLPSWALADGKIKERLADPPPGRRSPAR